MNRLSIELAASTSESGLPWSSLVALSRSGLHFRERCQFLVMQTINLKFARGITRLRHFPCAIFIELQGLEIHSPVCILSLTQYPHIDTHNLEKITRTLHTTYAMSSRTLFGKPSSTSALPLLKNPISPRERTFPRDHPMHRSRVHVLDRRQATLKD